MKASCEKTILISANDNTHLVYFQVNISSEHVSVTGEANLSGALVLVRQYICSIPKDSLMNQFGVRLKIYINSYIYTSVYRRLNSDSTYY